MQSTEALWREGANVAGRLGCERPRRRTASSAFTLVEVMIAGGVMAVMIVSLYGAFTFGFAQIESTRENIRASQILQQKMELVRLLNWDQVINLPGYIPSTFQEPFFAKSATNSTPKGITYSGTITISAAPMTESYGKDVRMIKAEVTWQSGNVNHKRQMTTFVTQYGIQKYVY